MKPLLLALLTLVCTLPIRADNWLQNGDFVDGIDHWRGDGRAPADYASENPLGKPDPLTSKGGLIIPLRQTDWDVVQQDFHGKHTGGFLTITYLVSPDLAFSPTPDAYANIPEKIHLEGWKPFSLPPGDWLVFLADFGSDHGTYWKIHPKASSGAPQTFRVKVTRLTPFEMKAIILAFPPGVGKLAILSVSLSDD